MPSAQDRLAAIRAAQPPEGLFAEKDWLLTPEPFVISAALAEQLGKLGHRLNLFQRACNELYHRSVSGKQPAWIAAYLDAGKPADLIAYARRRETRADLPAIIRPDLVLTDDGFTIAELDSVPGGLGLTHWLNTTYAAHGTHDILGGATGMFDGFLQILGGGPATVLIAQEAATYRPEMQYLARLSAGALTVADAESFSPESGRKMEGTESFSPEGWRKLAGGEASLRAATTGSPRANAPHPGRGAGTSAAPAGADFVAGPVPGVSPPANFHQPSGLSLYRFFEHFDLPNIPAAAAIMQAVADGTAKITPPFKPYLEEKLWFALFWLRPLREYWRRELSERHFLELQKVIPYTWIMDPTPLPQHAVIPGLEIHSWEELKAFSQKQRELILKISGFHETAWGSRSVVLGSDSSHPEWQAALDTALASPQPYILQRFHKGRLVEQPYLDPATGQLAVMRGRVRLCPYYFVLDGKASLRGALATICPPDKKLLHGMRDAIMAPTAVAA